MNFIVAWGVGCYSVWEATEFRGRVERLRRRRREIEEEMIWYYYDEFGIIGVLSYDDVLKAVEGGRLKRMLEKYKRYVKETESEA